MITHYLKIAFRSLLKYRQQTIISVLGLAVGFVCFALSSFWIWYETSFDSFHSGADRIYVARLEQVNNKHINSVTPYKLAAYLSETLPEVESACRVNTGSYKAFLFDDGQKVLKPLYVDSAFFDLFSISVLDQNNRLSFGATGAMVITDRAISLFPKNKKYSASSLLTLQENSGETCLVPISTIVKAWPQHTNLRFDLLQPLILDRNNDDWNSHWLYTLVRLREGVDFDQFQAKIDTLKIPSGENYRLNLSPLGEAYYKNVFSSSKQVQYKYIPFFALAGLLVICSALFNFLSLYISRLRMKGKELILRKVHGALDKQLLWQMMVEVAVVLLLVLFFSCLLLEWIYPLFESVTAMQLPRQEVFTKLIFQFIALLLVTLVISAIPIGYFKSQTLQQALRDTGSGHSRKLFSSVSLAVQSMVGIFFLFSTIVMAWQIHYAQHIDLGFDRREVISVVSYSGWKGSDAEIFLSEIKKEPFILDAVASTEMFLPQSSSLKVNKKDKEGKDVLLEQFFVRSNVINLLGIQVVDGRVPQAEENAVLLTQEAANLDSLYRLGATMTYTYYNEGFRSRTVPIVGIVKDFQYGYPKLKADPVMLIHDPDVKDINRILVKYLPGKRAEADYAIRSILKNKLEWESPSISYMDDEYNDYFREDSIILNILSILALVCMLVTFFGIYAMISLVCEQRRKEIAIRKINGASIKTLLQLFVKEYLVILLVGALLVFPIGYYTMQMWIEQYNNRIDIVPVYMLVVALTLLLVTIIVVAWVWRSIHLNPAQELEKE